MRVHLSLVSGFDASSPKMPAVVAATTGACEHVRANTMRPSVKKIKSEKPFLTFSKGNSIGQFSWLVCKKAKGARA
jgi:hypothetical protein